VATFEQLQVDGPELDAIRRKELARRLIIRAGHHLLAGRKSDARADLRRARETDAAAHRLLRFVASLAAHTPFAGPAVARIARWLLPD
jgi:hypothetical protein